MVSRRTTALMILILAFGLLVPLSAEAPPRRDLLEVKFKEINEKGYPMFEVMNKTGKNIETIRGGFIVETPKGEYVASTGHTIAVPGQLFLAAGKSMEMPPYGFNRKEKLMQTLRTDPDSLRYYFEVHDITFLKGGKSSQYVPASK